ncbi:MAG: hypothetical protein R3Y18_05060 [Bacillota bacterium]
MGMPVIETSGVTRCEAITDIIASVALEQAALAHILNAEGEKIQRVVADKEVTSEQLLEFNNSVSDMVGTVAELEKILISKLGLFTDCLCKCDEEVKEEVEVVEEEVIVKDETEVTKTAEAL